MSAVIMLSLAIGCVFVAGVIASGEAALARVSRRDAAKWAEQGLRGAVDVQRALADPARIVNVAVFIRLLLEALAVALVAAWLTTVWHNAWAAIAVTAGSMGVVVFAFVGVSPRTVGRMYAERVALTVIPPLRAITAFAGPVARLLVMITNAITPGKVLREGPFASEVELRTAVDVASESAVIDAEERRMVQAVFELGDTLVREVMVPRTDLVTIVSQETLERAMRLFIRSGHSRVPVIGEDRDDVLGVLYFKDVARSLYGPSGGEGIVDHVMRPAHFVPDSLTVEKLMEQMQNSSSHLSVLVDEYGGVAGLVTMEDLVEEIVGEISDEHDPVDDDFEELPDGSYRVKSRMSISDMGELFGLELDDQEVDTVGGLLAKAIGKVPIPGATASIYGLKLVAENLEGRRKRLATIVVSRNPQRSLDITDAPSGAQAE